MGDKAVPPKNSGFVLVEPSDVAKEDKIALKVEEQDGQYVLRASKGSALPQHLAVVNDKDEVLVVYKAGSLGWVDEAPAKPDTTITVSGHSLGGALSPAYALWLRKQ